MKRFYLISLPRSGGTAVQRMLDSGEGQWCSGETGRMLELQLEAEKRPGAVKGNWRRAEVRLPEFADVEWSYGIRSSFLGREGWERAVECWSWLLRDPRSVIVFVMRDNDPEGKAELSLFGTAALWIPEFGKCSGRVWTRWRAMRQSMLDFHEMNPGTTVVLRMEELEDYGGLVAKLGERGLKVSRAAWERVMEERPGRLKAAMDEIYPQPEHDEGAVDPFADAGGVVETVEEFDSVEVDPFAQAERAAAKRAKGLRKLGRRPAPVLELRPRDEGPVMSVAVMAHPSRKAWVEELTNFFGPGCRVAMDDDGRGMLANGMEAWRLHDADADYHLVIQDDALPCADFMVEARRYLAGLSEPGAVSFYHSGKPKFRARAIERAREGELRGWLRWGPAIALPVTWIPEMLEFFAAQKRPQYDTRIGDWLRAKGRLCRYPLPSLVEHRGSESLIGNGRRGERKAALLRRVHVGRTVEEARAMPDVPAAIVYPWIACQAAWEELRYSLRSVETYFADRDCPIYVLGDRKPDWLIDGGRVRFIELDEYRRHPKSRVPAVFQAKVIGLQLARRTLWMNDDFYLLRRQGWESFAKALHAGKVRPEELLEHGSGWEQNIGASIRAVLGPEVAEGWKFSTHTPQLYERDQALEVLRKFHVPFSGGFENLYHNYHGTPRQALGGARVSTLPARKSARFLNHTKEGPNRETRAELRRMFPAAAPWERTVPKRIHQIWTNDDPEVPRSVYPEEWTESWQLLHPQWEYRLWSRADLQALAAADYPEFAELFAKARDVVKADVGRLLVMHKHGGLYADLDYLCLRPMDALVDGGSLWLNTLGNYTHNAIFAAIEGREWFLTAAREALKRWKEKPGGSPEWIGGPNLFMDLEERAGRCRWGREVCPLDWRGGDHEGDWRELLAGCGDAYAVTFWRHNW